MGSKDDVSFGGVEENSGADVEPKDQTEDDGEEAVDF